MRDTRSGGSCTGSAQALQHRGRHDALHDRARALAQRRRMEVRGAAQAAARHDDVRRDALLRTPVLLVAREATQEVVAPLAAANELANDRRTQGLAVAGRGI